MSDDIETDIIGPIDDTKEQQGHNLKEMHVDYKLLKEEVLRLQGEIEACIKSTTSQTDTRNFHHNIHKMVLLSQKRTEHLKAFQKGVIQGGKDIEYQELMFLDDRKTLAGLVPYALKTLAGIVKAGKAVAGQGVVVSACNSILDRSGFSMRVGDIQGVQEMSNQDASKMTTQELEAMLLQKQAQSKDVTPKQKKK